MSGLLGQILGGMTGGQHAQGSPIVSILQEVFASPDGQTSGVAALISRFQQSGMGDHVNSWVSTGANKPVTPEQISQVFSPQQIQSWATQAGTTPERLQGVLAEALPQMVDHMTPDGTPPATVAQSATPDIGSLLAGLMGRGAAPRSA